MEEKYEFLLSIYLSFDDTVAKELLETSSILRLYPEKESSISWLSIYSITKGYCLYKGLDRQYGSGAIPAANVSDMSAAKRSTPTKAFIIDIRIIKVIDFLHLRFYVVSSIRNNLNVLWAL